MIQQVITIRPPAIVREPRGAWLAAEAAAGVQKGAQLLAKGARAVWSALEDEGRRRAERALRSRGTSIAAIEAARVRAMADEHERSDPRFAAELRAAASRHEALHGIE